MEISCTKKLIELIGGTASVKSGEASLYDWHANVITRNRRKILVLLNDCTHFVIVLYGIRANHFNNFPALISNAIKDMFHHLDYSDTIATKYFQNAEGTSLTKTNRSLISSMNQVVQMIGYYPNSELEDGMQQWKLSEWINKMPVKASGRGYIFPCDEFRKAMSEI